MLHEITISCYEYACAPAHILTLAFLYGGVAGAVLLPIA